MAKFPDEPLGDNQIRILELAPGSENDDLKASFRRANMEVVIDRHIMPEQWKLPCLEYRAISYAWGQPIFSHTISVSSQEVHITSSLNSALRRLRQTYNAIFLWVDQLCINQSDIQERSAQVRIMDKIYSNAEEVCIWLGNEGPNDGIAFRMMNFLLHNAADIAASNLSATTQERGKRIFGHFEHEWNFQIGDGKFYDGYLVLFELVRKSWFGRVWVVQEASLAKQAYIYCGHFRMPFADALRSFKILLGLVDLFRINAASLDRLRRVMVLYDNLHLAQAGTLLGILVSAWDLQASEPRDRVFALIPLARFGRKIRSDIDVDYSISLQDLWRRVARFILQEESAAAAASMLALRATQNEVSGDGSSWAPDFGKMSALSSKKYRWYLRDVRISRAGGRSDVSALAPTLPQAASHGKNIHVEESQNAIEDSERVKACVNEAESSILRIRGFHLGSVRSILPNSHQPSLGPLPMAPLPHLVRDLFPWRRKCREFAHKHHFNFGSKRQFSLLLFQGVVARDPEEPFIPHSDSQHFRSLRSDLSDIISSETASLDTEGIGEILNDLQPLIFPQQQMSNLDQTRLLAAMSNGYLGWMPREATVGDSIHLLSGYPAPFVTRKRDDRYYEIVGDAYIHDVMKGEAWPRDESKIEIIELK